jgi:hypothetical protein
MKLPIAGCRSPIGVALTVVLALATGQIVRGETIDRVLAVVNGRVITLSDVMAAQELGLVPAGTAADPIRPVLSRLIDRALELSEVDRYAPPEPTTEAMEREVRAVRARFPNETAFEVALARSGVDLQRLRETLRDDLRIQAYLDQRFAAAADRRQPLIADWLAGLRRRAELTDLYLTER